MTLNVRSYDEDLPDRLLTSIGFAVSAWSATCVRKRYVVWCYLHQAEIQDAAEMALSQSARSECSASGESKWSTSSSNKFVLTLLFRKLVTRDEPFNLVFSTLSGFCKMSVVFSLSD